MQQIIRLSEIWVLGECIGSGGFGQVFAAAEAESQKTAVVKLIRKAEGADRELLFVDLEGVPNVVPILDSGETDDNWVIVMPRAEGSLRHYIEQNDGVLPVADAVAVLKDICDALVALDGRVVHRDLKPENVLLLDGKWCLADFGISRYAEATTAPDTQKYAMSPLYAAPERWRDERATSSTDVYSLGVIAFELIMGSRPFEGKSSAELRQLHLHADPPSVDGAPLGLRALIDECLYKAPEARPSAANIRQRLERITQSSDLAGLSRLQEANLAEVRRKAEESRAISAARSLAEQRAAIAAAGQRGFIRISEQLKLAITEHAPAASLVDSSGGGWQLKLGPATLKLGSVERLPPEVWGGYPFSAFDVVCVSTIDLRIPRDRYDYEGRSHSLWYCDAAEEGQFGWFETAFWFSGISSRQSSQVPFAMNPGVEAAQALAPVIDVRNVAWPFTLLASEELDEFVDRWAGWFADAAGGQLSHPRSMPERRPEGSWRSRGH